MAKLAQYIPEIKIQPKGMEGKKVLEKILQEEKDYILSYDTIEKYIEFFGNPNPEEEEELYTYFTNVYPYIDVDHTSRYFTQITMKKAYKDMIWFEDSNGDGFYFIHHNYGTLDL
jgi:hypothetical protein